ncbi:hypothetical protein CC78DRAFT_594941 [Lojkania enalia]|uniref:Uncharacterized protein n=1 Tax=Lojkania enalia TaxID=147567 RepID=A0A9P4JXZ7_9PLEO|nr:hypothetical protein CC78DRAFT_594941 [Didymosphaeria enalia]
MAPDGIRGQRVRWGCRRGGDWAIKEHCLARLQASGWPTAMRGGGVCGRAYMVNGEARRRIGCSGLRWLRCAKPWQVMQCGVDPGGPRTTMTERPQTSPVWYGTVVAPAITAAITLGNGNDNPLTLLDDRWEPPKASPPAWSSPALRLRDSAAGHNAQTSAQCAEASIANGVAGQASTPGLTSSASFLCASSRCTYPTGTVVVSLAAYPTLSHHLARSSWCVSQTLSCQQGPPRRMVKLASRDSGPAVREA